MTELESARHLLAGSFLATALICGLVSIPLVRGRVRMNRIYGVRIRKAFASEANWYALNRFGGWQLIGYAVGLGLAGGLLYFVPLDGEGWYLWPLLLSPLWLLLPVLWRILAFARTLP